MGTLVDLKEYRLKKALKKAKTNIKSADLNREASVNKRVHDIKKSITNLNNLIRELREKEVE